jgi:hypothetical protein
MMIILGYFGSRESIWSLFLSPRSVSCGITGRFRLLAVGHGQVETAKK